MKTFCSLCRNECGYKIINEGIGPYEYWGAICNDTQLAVVSTCCREYCLDEYDDPISADEAKDFEALLKAEQQMRD